MKKNRMKLIAISLLVVMQAGFIAQKTMSANLQKGSQTSSNESICIYPNPMQGKSIISFWVKQAGNTHINAYSIDGRKVISTSENLQKGKNVFQLSLPKGVYMIQVAGNGFSYSTKVINLTSNKIKPELVFAGVDNTETPVTDDSQYPTSINSMGAPGGSSIYGQDFLGGKIAYLLKASDPGYIAEKTRGIVMSKVDLSASATWGCQGIIIPNLDYSTWNTGCSNNNAIVNGCSTPSIAAALCQTYSSDGYGNWYLPSVNELIKINQNSTIHSYFEYADYWSSTQINSNQVATYNFASYAQMYALKSELKRVRAVKTFSVDVPTLTTTGISSLTITSAVCGVSISNDGGAPILYRGVCSSTGQNPTTNGYSSNGNGTGTGTFTTSITNLIPNTTYYVRAYATTIFGVNYSGQISFKTPEAAKPDLIVGNVNIVNNSGLDMVGEMFAFENGDVITSSFTVKNQGLGNSDETIVKYYLSTNPNLTTFTSDIQLADTPTSSISSGEVFTSNSVTSTIPLYLGSTSATTYYLYAVVDPNNYISESNESNNVLKTAIFIYGGANQ